MKRKISGRQSRAARELLKWNINDVVRATSIRTKEIEEFESGLVPLPEGDVDELARLYEKEDIEFLLNGDVIRKVPEKKDPFHAFVPPHAAAPPPTAPVVAKSAPKPSHSVTKVVGNMAINQSVKSIVRPQPPKKKPRI